MIDASGVSFEDAQVIIEHIANVKAAQYRSIAYYNSEDIKQEVRIKCWKIVKDGKYNPERSADLKTFLTVCADNRIRDIKRSILYKHNKPCIRCPFYNKDLDAQGKHDCVAFLDKMQCESYANHQRYVQAKLSASHPIDIDNQRVVDETPEEYAGLSELVDFILVKLPKKLLDDFNIFRNSNFNEKSLPARRRRILLDSLRRIMEGYNEA